MMALIKLLYLSDSGREIVCAGDKWNTAFGRQADNDPQFMSQTTRRVLILKGVGAWKS